MLVTEGGHLAHLKLFGNEIVQGRYQKKILAENTINIHKEKV